MSLRERVVLSPHQRFRLVGVGLSNFFDPEDASAQPALFTQTERVVVQFRLVDLASVGKAECPEKSVYLNQNRLIARALPIPQQ